MCLLGWLLVALPFISLAPKFVLIAHTLGTSGTQIFQTGFGFGDYVQNLATDGTFRSCTTFPYKSCGTPACNYATRMPGLPLVYTGLSQLVGNSSAAVALAKCALMALLSAVFLFTFVTDARPSIGAVILLYVLYLGPQSLKHGASLEYEEGMLVDLELCLAIAMLYLWRPELTDSIRRRSAMAVAAVAIATAMYFIKTTALLTLFVVLVTLLLNRHVGRMSKIAAVLCAGVPMLLWVGHTYSTSGEFHLSSSWNGENLYRGSSAAGLALYPQVSLDRMFDSSQATLRDGRIVALQSLTDRYCFSNEWQWNRFYAKAARDWAVQHPLDWTRFLLQKVWTAVIEVRHTPYSTSSDGAEIEYPATLGAVMLIWMVFARMAFLALLTLLVRAAFQRESPALWVLALIAAAWAPYLGVFSYQRHVIPLLVMVGVLLAGLYSSHPRLLQNRHTRLLSSTANAPLL